MGDWIKLHRLIVSWEWFTTPNMLVFWVYCLTRASYKDSRYKGIELQAGQFIDGRKAMALHTGLTESQVRTCLERLKSTNEIASKSTTEYTVFTINSWKKYQIDNDDRQPFSQPIASQSPANRHIQEVKKEKKEKNNTTFVPPELNEIFEFSKTLNWSGDHFGCAESFFTYRAGQQWKGVKDWKMTYRNYLTMDWQRFLVRILESKAEQLKPKIHERFL